MKITETAYKVLRKEHKQSEGIVIFGTGGDCPTQYFPINAAYIALDIFWF